MLTPYQESIKKSPTATELAILREIAEAATPGPWAWGQTPVANPAEAVEICRQNIDATKEPAEEFCEVFLQDGRRTAMVGNGPTSAANARFIAVFNPAAILAILAQLELVQADAARLDFAQSTVIDGQADTWRIDIDHYDGMTLREALDAARALPPPPEAA